MLLTINSFRQLFPEFAGPVLNIKYMVLDHALLHCYFIKPPPQKQVLYGISVSYLFVRFSVANAYLRPLAPGTAAQYCRQPSSSSSRMRVVNHNWSSTKQRLHLQSVAEISCHSVLSGDRIRQCGTSSESRYKDTYQCL